MIDLEVTQIVDPAILVMVSDDKEQWKEATLYSIDHRLFYPFATHNSRYTFCKKIQEDKDAQR